ncbi:cell division protein FtsL [Desulfobulbus oligotrophicus]|uniref:Cell division protein FtsL n=1 Tax=Desulfobulbus oligotrophicus TaxID=1909699 RepID=A0A7T6AQC5_9BACT|nr:cell division protein FtsL [Desulfobulbus oligotrophicus]QQG65345.1 cell division protein FtsL [Desulfobulbus oligotrophicus]
MTPTVGVQTFKPRQQIFTQERTQVSSQFCCILSIVQTRVFAVVALVVLVLGIGLTQIIQTAMSDLQERASHLRSGNIAVANENVRLLATRAQLSSKAQVIALAGTRLHLFEPDQKQVRRM